MATKQKVEAVEPVKIKVERAIITIDGTSDLVLNKMNSSAARALIADDRKTQKLWEQQHRNKWEDIITAIHWKDGIPVEDTNSECTEALFYEMLEKNTPCLTAFGLKKSWGQTVVRQEIDKFSTKFDAAVNIVSTGGLVPIRFAKWALDERVMNPKTGKGSAVTVRLNHFCGWSADIMIEYTTNVYKLNEIIAVIDYAGFSIGIGSGRSSGYGRYHITNVR